MQGLDNIRIRGMEFYAYHGVLPEETVIGQRFVVDITLCLSLRRAGETDDLEETVNYASVYDKVKDVMQGEPVKLIETLAERTATVLLGDFESLSRVDVTVVKPNAPIAGVFSDVSVTVVRERT